MALFLLPLPILLIFSIAKSAHSDCVNLIPGADYLAQHNLITLDSLQSSSHVGLTTICCGNFTGTGSPKFAINAETFPPQNVSLAISGYVFGGGQVAVNHGSCTVGSSNTIQSTTSKQYVNGNIFKMSGGSGSTLRIDTTLTEQCNRIIHDIEMLSTILASKPSNNIVSIPQNSPTTLNFIVTTVDAHQVAYFNVSCLDTFQNSNVQQILVTNTANAQLIVINCYGLAVTYNKNMVGDWLGGSKGRSQTVFNFVNTQTLTLTSEFCGTLLAPYATVNTTAVIRGTTAVQRFIQTGEVHGPTTQFPCIPNSDLKLSIDSACNNAEDSGIISTFDA
ncbi:unnamed protein product [Didymodactylos carnosus]|uniref:Choice-of-anchor A domain-containing protein n=1 Tax=Didymodactylos carnosus TaxID=1234261 RepID=A0A815HM65_9BILA|nr:unnamed protein product [Didymodactylos carnosus]CAF1357196.1 unnamed protein product [Didymodactylos carnosus]CAF4167471.1 unnamed protein product [Didymodactylos carnosus]CAF4227112.1 unnamed protein product [Didymodactylos carnosus]